ncbi:MAG: hypothetical protein ABSG89_04610 [Bacteroidales bacterium]|jgi:hypothetical protein
MKKLFKISYPVKVLLLILVLSGCTKKLSDMELMTDHSWKWDKMTTSSTNSTVISMVSLVSALFTSEEIVFDFTTDGNYKVTAMGDSTIASGTWSLQENDTKLMLDAAEANIVSLTKTQLAFQESQSDSTGTYTLTYYLKN